MARRITYDFGSNNGDDIPYYLLKSDLVVAVEANPILSKKIKRRFSSEIKQGRLVVESCVLTAEENAKTVSFYIHKKKHVLSQFPKPSPDKLNDYKEVHLPSKTVVGIIGEHGQPYYVKIDIEHYDAEILRALLAHQIYPPYVSAEAHSIEIFPLMENMGYKAFKLVTGNTVREIYRQRSIESERGSVLYSFPKHSAGPFGNDIDGKWMTADNFRKALTDQGLGWKDIHASRIDFPDEEAILLPEHTILPRKNGWFRMRIRSWRMSWRRIRGLFKKQPAD